METKGKKSLLYGIQPWALSLVTAFLSIFILFFIADFLGEVIGYISYDIVIVIACFFICKKYPSSIWYAPVICNIVGIMGAFGEENFYWLSTLWIIICGGWILSLIAASIGAFTGHHKVLRK